MRGRYSPKTRRVMGMGREVLKRYDAPVAIGKAHQSLRGVLADR
jgi:hypothetical protein